MVTEESLTQALYLWESRFRGWYSYSDSVSIEPTFSPFYINEDQKVTTTKKIFGVFPIYSQKKEEPIVDIPSPRIYQNSENLKSIELNIPSGYNLNSLVGSEFLILASSSQAPVSFEIIGTQDKIKVRIVCSESDYNMIFNLIGSLFHEIEIQIGDLNFPFEPSSNVGIIDFGLENETFFPLRKGNSYSVDSLTSILNLFQGLNEGETAAYQVSFEATRFSWGSEFRRLLFDESGKCLIRDSSAFQKHIQEKLNSVWMCCRVRGIVQGSNLQETSRLGQMFVRAMQSFSLQESNGLIPLSNDGIHLEDHILDCLHRESSRNGFLVSIEELQSLVHIPSHPEHYSKLSRSPRRTVTVPQTLKTGQIEIGTSTHLGIESKIFLSQPERLRHCHVIGATGVGKSTFVTQCVLQDVSLGNGVTVFDPHGDLIEDILMRIPTHRIDEVIVFDPSDTHHPIGINLFQTRSEGEKVVLGSDLISIFKQQATSWGDSMHIILSMAISAFLDRSEPGTLLELRMFLQDKNFRNSILNDVEDLTIRYFWEKEFPTMRKGATAPIITRLNMFLGPKAIRHTMAIRDGLDFHSILNGKKIFLVKLPQGLIGQQNSYLLGSLILSKLFQAALGRQATIKSDRIPHYIFIDEFHNFLSQSLTQALTGIRKYAIGLNLIHQNLAQLRSFEELKEALVANAAIKVAFRLGEQDARIYQSNFQNFEAEDFTSLGIGQAIVSVGSSSINCALDSHKLNSASTDQTNNAEAVLQKSRSKYANSISEVSEHINSLFQTSDHKSSQENFSTPSNLVKNTSSKPEDQTSYSVKIKSNKSFKEQVEDTHSQQVEKKVKNRHLTLQQTVRTFAQNNGWKAEIEKVIPHGRIDVLLQKENTIVGIEVSVGNNDDYELQNVQKCLDYGCQNVFLLIEDEEKRIRLSKKIDNKKVAVFDLQQIKDWIISQTKEEIQTIAGYKVQVNRTRNLDESTQEQLRKVILKSSAQKSKGRTDKD